MDEKKILVVEDDLVTTTFLDSILKKNGYNVVLAHNGKMALLLIKAMKPDLIITDVIMPEMNGFEFYKIIRKRPDLKDVPIIVLSGRKDIGEVFIEMDIDEFLPKPIDSEKMLSKIKDLLTNGRDKTKKAAGGSSSSGINLLTNKYFWISLIAVAVAGLGFMMHSMVTHLSNKEMGKQEMRVVDENGQVIVLDDELTDIPE